MARIWTEGFEFRHSTSYTIYVGNTEIPKVYVGNTLLTDYNIYHNPNTIDLKDE